MKRFACMVFLLALLPISICGQQASPDLVLLNGKVFTADSVNPHVEAVTIRGERIKE